MTHADLTARYSDDTRAAAEAWLADGTPIPDTVLSQHAGEWAILTATNDGARSVRERAEVVQRAWHDLLAPASSIAKLARGVADHYHPWESSSAEEADTAARLQLDAVVAAIRRRHAAAEDRARAVALRHQSRVANEPIEFPGGVEQLVVFVVGAAAALIASTTVPSTSGWRTLWYIVAAAVAAAGAYVVIRRPRIIIDGYGVELHRALWTTRFPWRGIVDAEVGSYETRHALFWTQEHEQLFLIVRADGADEARRKIIPSYGHEPELLQAEIAAYAAARGVELVDQPKPPRPTFIQLLPGYIGGVVLFAVLTWGAGSCNGDCGVGAIVAMLDRRVDTAQVETAIALDLQADHPGAGYVECPDTVKNDPDATFTCDVEDLPEVTAVDVHFTSHRHDDYEFEVR